MKNSDMQRKVNEVLKQYWGFDSLRPAQAEPIYALMQNRDTLAVMPTGYGKSLCFQIPALLLPGVAIVFSPLISLMKDQVDKLVQRKLPAAYINSTLKASEVKKVMQRVTKGKIKLLYIAPERLKKKSFVEFLSDLDVSMVAVDEAHSISVWGHDFRPYYRKIPKLYKKLSGDPVRAAFTATATPYVRDDIVETMNLREPLVHVSGFARPNIGIHCKEVPGSYKAIIEVNKTARLVELAKLEGAGIIYCGTRKYCQEIYETLLKRLSYRTVVMYHGGMNAGEREKNQYEFMESSDPICVATSAFGMGIDRPDTRWVIFAYSPLTMNDFYQGIGRAGRDGKESIGVLLYSDIDDYLQKFLIEMNTPPPSVIETVFNYIYGMAESDRLIDTYEAIENATGVYLPIVKAAVRFLRSKDVISVDAAHPFWVKTRKAFAELEPVGYKEKLLYDHIRSMLKPKKFYTIHAKDVQGLCEREVDQILRAWSAKKVVKYKYVGKIVFRITNPMVDLLEYARYYRYRMDEAQKVLDFPATHCKQRYILDYYGDRTPVENCLCDSCTR